MCAEQNMLLYQLVPVVLKTQVDKGESRLVLSGLCTTTYDRTVMQSQQPMEAA